jgi:small neutral amino acid transporter SnatA (MarC family)
MRFKKKIVILLLYVKKGESLIMSQSSFELEFSSSSSDLEPFFLEKAKENNVVERKHERKALPAAPPLVSGPGRLSLKRPTKRDDLPRYEAWLLFFLFSSFFFAPALFLALFSRFFVNLLGRLLLVVVARANFWMQRTAWTRGRGCSMN